MIQGYAIPNATMLGNNGAYKSQFYKALEGAKAAGATVEEAPCLLARGVEAYNDGLPSTPSLLIVPQFYKAGNLYQDVPPFVAEDSTMRFTVSRNTTATRVNSSGLIESVASGVPRIDWLGQSCPALLVEASGTNVLSYSEEFTNAAWSKNEMTISTGTTALFTAPDGTTNADKIIATTTSGVTHSIQRSGLASAAYTFSVFAKAGEESVISLWLRGASVRAEFNLVSGTISNITVTSAIIENYGNGWYRCTVYDSTPGTTAHVYGRGGGAYAGNGSDGFYLWGAQLETGSIATTYIPTTTAAVSRAADVISASGALVSGLIGQTEGTVFIDFVYRRNAPSGLIPILLTNTSADQVYVHIRPSEDIGVDYYYNSSFSARLFTATGFVVNNTRYKVAFVYKENDFALYINGQQIATYNSGIVRSLTSLHLVYPYLTGYGPAGQTVNQAALYTTRLTNAELAILTSL